MKYIKRYQAHIALSLFMLSGIVMFVAYELREIRFREMSKELTQVKRDLKTSDKNSSEYVAEIGRLNSCLDSYDNGLGDGERLITPVEVYCAIYRDNYYD